MPHIHVDGCEIHYEVKGRGEVVLLLHGLGSSLLDWEMQIPALAERYTVVAVDMRGHGRSGKPPGPYRIATFAADVAQVMRALALGPAHVVGISMGGMIGFQLAVDHPSLVRSLVVVNSAPAFVPRTLRERLAVVQRIVALRVLGLPGFARKIAEKNLPRPDQEALRRKLAARLAQNDEAAYRAASYAILGWSVAERIGTIRCPVLVVTGDQDYTPVAAKEAYAARIPRARVAVVADSRHCTPIDQPEAFNQLLLDFLKEHATAPAEHGEVCHGT
ncbi:alpha/beta fold hydrolase [Polyangium mundeleinium]|uniref:Alpha/beta hydrolase n=1 Tax=Polyangium mundeleinium TaxID=2995306 RepID=A0ABT5EGR4_9BACT|nr:alpha/beta hydrolase [Polyangium mundeleinium]MDC0740679.1 alpha/beta hydrolase [Polyangium mundeleinium]